MTMELQELLMIDPKSLTARQAQVVVGETIRTLADGVMHQHQQPLKDLLRETQLIATGQNTDEPQPDTRQDVLKRIEDAEARGDKRAAYFLRQGMLDADTAAVTAEEQAEVAKAATDKFIADDLAADEAKRERRQQELIEARTQELVYAHGWERSAEELREQATQEVLRSTDDEP
jgi:hypothetical protein